MGGAAIGVVVPKGLPLPGLFLVFSSLAFDPRGHLASPMPASFRTRHAGHVFLAAPFRRCGAAHRARRQLALWLSLVPARAGLSRKRLDRSRGRSHAISAAHWTDDRRVRCAGTIGCGVGERSFSRRCSRGSRRAHHHRHHDSGEHVSIGGAVCSRWRCRCRTRCALRRGPGRQPRRNAERWRHSRRRRYGSGILLHSRYGRARPARRDHVHERRELLPHAALLCALLDRFTW